MTFSGAIAVSRRLLAALALLAAVNLLIAVFIVFTQPQRALDLLAVREWCADWLRRGLDVFSQVDSISDYPPNAIVTFSTLALIPVRAVVPAWTVVALALVAALPVVVSRAAGIRDRTATMLVVVAFLCWASARTLLQFSVLSMTLAFAAIWIADANAVAAGVLLGLALAKPQIGGPVAVWAVLAGRTRLVAAAMATVAAGILTYGARVRLPPWTVMFEYWNGLTSTYASASELVGVTSVREWMPSNAAWLAVAGALLIPTLAIAVRWRHASGVSRLIAPAAVSLWSLLALYHNSNNLILMLPAVVLFVMTGHRRAALAMQLLLMIDVPYRLAPLAGPRLIHALLASTNRLLVLATFAYLVRAAWSRKTV